jgi:CBS domain-containing membrane protein
MYLAKKFLGALRGFAGVGTNTTGHLEKWVSGAGGLTGILGVTLVSQAYLGLNGGASLVASMGASAVLLFAVPHGPLSQPWAVFGGHMVSAVIGVACAGLHAPPLVTGALAVALAISAMYYLRCIHPPGGATALTAVAGGDAIHALGFHYVLTPVLLNVLIILSVAILFNLPFPWRRYPAVWARKRHQPASPGADDESAVGVFSREALTAAARTKDPALSLSEDTLEAVCSLTLCKDEAAAMRPTDIRVGGYYCNGAFGPHWQVRLVVEIVDGEVSAGKESATVIYKVVAGYGRRRRRSASRTALADWARYEVRLNENSWQRVETTPCPVVTGNAA